jgi:hypothetical protein
MAWNTAGVGGGGVQIPVKTMLFFFGNLCCMIAEMCVTMMVVLLWQSLYMGVTAVAVLYASVSVGN